MEIGDIVEITPEVNAFWAGLAVVRRFWENGPGEPRTVSVVPFTGKAKSIMGIGEGGFLETDLIVRHGYVHVNREKVEEDYTRYAI